MAEMEQEKSSNKTRRGGTHKKPAAAGRGATSSGSTIPKGGKKPAKTATRKKASTKTTPRKKVTSRRAPRKETRGAAQTLTPEERHRLIAEAAYIRAERRDFEGGCPESDWLEAETEVDARLLTPSEDKS